MTEWISLTSQILSLKITNFLNQLCMTYLFTKWERSLILNWIYRAHFLLFHLDLLHVSELLFNQPDLTPNTNVESWKFPIFLPSELKPFQSESVDPHIKLSNYWPKVYNKLWMLKYYYKIFLAPLDSFFI